MNCKTTVVCRTEDAPAFLSAGSKVTAQRTDGIVELAKSTNSSSDGALALPDAITDVLLESSKKGEVVARSRGTAPFPLLAVDRESL